MDNIFYKNKNFIWFNLTNPTQEEIIAFTKKYHLSLYTVMDSLEPGHLPKIETQNNANFILVRFYLKNEELFLNSVREFTNKIAIFYGNNFIITIHQNEIYFLNEIKKSFLNLNPLLTINECVTKIIWYVANSYLNPILSVSDKINTFEKYLYNKKLKSTEVNKIYDIKRESSTLKRVLIMSNEVINIYKTTEIDNSSLQDTKELHQKLIHLCEQNIEDSYNIMNTFLSLSSKKTNDTVQLLTIFSAFFLPLTFIVGAYGINFKYMPELQYHWGYPLIILIMVVLSIAIYFWFRRMKIL